MTTDKDIGRLEGKMELMLAQQSEIGRKLDKMMAEGCAQLPQHLNFYREIKSENADLKKRVGELESQWKKAMLSLLIFVGGTKLGEWGWKMFIGG